MFSDIKEVRYSETDVIRVRSREHLTRVSSKQEI